MSCCWRQGSGVKLADPHLGAVRTRSGLLRERPLQRLSQRRTKSIFYFSFNFRSTFAISSDMALRSLSASNNLMMFSAFRASAPLIR